MESKIYPRSPTRETRRPVHDDWRPTKLSEEDLQVELDMGEASREQGFRLNGCR